MAKYIITDQDELVIGADTFHQIMAEKVKGRVVRAGHVTFYQEAGVTHVYGSSIGYGIDSKEEDAKIIDRLLPNAIHI